MQEPGEILCDKKEFTQIRARVWPTIWWNSKRSCRTRSKSTSTDFSFGVPNNEFTKEERTDGRSISRRRKDIRAYQWLFQTDRTGTRQRWSVRATWSWIRFNVNIATNTSCHVWCYYGHSHVFVNPIPVVEKQIHPNVKQKLELLTRPAFVMIKEQTRGRTWVPRPNSKKGTKQKMLIAIA